MVRGYHQYEAIWAASIGEVLTCRREIAQVERKQPVSPWDFAGVQIVAPGISAVPWLTLVSATHVNLS